MTVSTCHVHGLPSRASRSQQITLQRSCRLQHLVTGTLQLDTFGERTASTAEAFARQRSCLVWWRNPGVPWSPDSCPTVRDKLQEQYATHSWGKSSFSGILQLLEKVQQLAHNSPEAGVRSSYCKPASCLAPLWLTTAAAPRSSQRFCEDPSVSHVLRTGVI